MFAAILATIALTAPAPHAQPVTLRQATQPPTYLRMLRAGQRVTVERQCPHGEYWSELSAYRWNGEALPAQRWNHDRDWLIWGRVYFDGITWLNQYRQPVLVAGWCE